MYLKNIEVYGFKSFANKISFKFHNGITAIVGPNGSGKSNVADAVRWVLGEQRARQLRGASMQDVIFAGTQNRKPVSYAYVSITLDNSDHSLPVDYDEVTIARRIYRSGESEYILNGSPCRLKDVNELFYDTGIGKEGYSIIGQGQIDLILSGKPEERRELFDEAAGIVKFKRRKHEAIRKLDREEQNMVRVSDILGELERQLAPLEKQSETAKEYLRLKEDLKRLDVNMFLLENARVSKQLEEVNVNYETADGELSETNEKYQSIKTEYERVESELEETERLIEDVRKTLAETGLNRSKLEGQINVLKEQISAALTNEEHYRKRLSSIDEELSEKDSSKEVLLEEKQDRDGAFSIMIDNREKARADLLKIQELTSDYNDKIETAKNSIIKGLNERAAIKSQIERFDTILEQSAVRAAELSAGLLRAKSDSAEQDDVIRHHESEFLRLSEEIKTLSEVQKGMETRVGEIKSELGASDNSLREAEVIYHRHKSKLESLKNITERYEGYGNSIRKVMEEKGKESGIIGVVADILNVKKEYETAIEIALGGSIQNIVTEDESTAKRMVEFLKVNKYGRATFLPLTGMNSKGFSNDAVLKEKGVLGLADSLVTVKERFRPVAASLLGRTVIVDNIDNALKIARKYNYSIRMVTIDGEMLAPGGSISGGAFRNTSNLLGRHREEAELEKLVNKAREDIDTYLAKMEGIKDERSKLRKEIEEKRVLIQELFIAQNTARVSIAKANEKKKESNSGLGNLEDLRRDTETQIREAKEQKEQELARLKDSQEVELRTEEEIARLQELLSGYRGDETSKTAKLSELEVEVEKMLQQKEFSTKNLERVEGERARLISERDELDGALAVQLSEREIKLKNIEEIEQTIAASHTLQGETEESLNASLKRKERLSLRRKEFFARRESLSERIAALDKEVYRLNALRERLEEGISTQISYMWEEYGITLSQAEGMRDAELTDITSMKKDIGSLKDGIKKLGDVNVNAIEEYKSLTERYGFLKGQYDDLIEAKETLLGIIEDLDTSMRKQFTEKFEQIALEFDSVFKEMFGGGKGTLEIMPDEDILEAGIKITAQPPGKKLQNMMQLSGGEKALTAIALLFAIQNLKPSPFCLLDEIEAALDESNVGRFAKYLHKLTDHTQFIVITHRRGTMERADRLYGITMREKGISALVSVNLDSGETGENEAV